MRRLRQFFVRHPFVGVAGSIASIVSVPLAVLFFYRSQLRRDLVYLVQPVRTVLVRHDRPDDLELSFLGEPLAGSDVVAVTLALWNNGSQSIETRDVLQRVAITFSPAVRILRVTVLKRSRAITRFRIAKDVIGRNARVVPLTWRILEPGDGGVIEVIYAGVANQDIAVSGIIKGQAAPRDVLGGVLAWLVFRPLSTAAPNHIQGLASHPVALLLVALMLLVFLGLPLVMKLSSLRSASRSAPWPPDAVKLLTVLTTAALVASFLGILSGLVISRLLTDPVPPFGF